MMSRAAVLGVFFLLTSVACSLVLDWDPEGLKCFGANSECDDGYSCFLGHCIGDGTLELGGTCTEPQQCSAGAGDVTCGSERPFACRKLCHNLFGPSGNCRSGEFCRPEESHDSPEQWMGTCFTTQCARDDGCAPDRICVPITASASACLIPCSYDFDSGSYQDNCGSAPESQQYCQLIGTSAGRELVCLEARINTASRPGEGALCDPVENPCQQDFVCLEKRCRRFCTVDTDCLDGEGCITISNDLGSVMRACQPAN